MPKLNGGIKNTLISILGTSVVLMLGFYLVSMQNYVSAADLSEAIDKESPYREDRALFHSMLEDIKDIKQDIGKIKEDIAALKERTE